MEIISSLGSLLAVLAIGYVLVKKFLINKSVATSQAEFKKEDNILDFKKKELIVDIDNLKKERAEKAAGKELTAEEIESYWKDKK